jgi:dienelactone hydrolase
MHRSTNKANSMPRTRLHAGRPALILIAAAVLAFGAISVLASQPAAPFPPSGPFRIRQTRLRLQERASATHRELDVEIRYPVLPQFSDKHPPPLILAVSGWGGSLDGNVSLAGDLASHGFVVASIGYPRGPDVPELSLPMDFSSDGSAASTAALADRKTRMQAEDVSFVIDALANAPRGGAPAIGAPRIDPDRIGIFGFSFGGAVAAQAGLRDDRIRAVMNLDGWLFADAAHEFFPQPYLVVNDGTPLPTSDDLRSSDPHTRNIAALTDRDYRHQDAQLRSGGGWKLTVVGSRHEQFSDPVAAGPIERLKSLRFIRPERAMAIIRYYALEFFRATLERQPASLLGGTATAPFAEVRMERFAMPLKGAAPEAEK